MSSIVTPGSPRLWQGFRARRLRNTTKSGHFKVSDDAIERLRSRTAKFAVLFSATGEAVLEWETRSRSAYYSVIAKAVSKLPNNTRQTRLALYDRAEIALAAELLRNPHVSAEQVAVERLALERAIRKVEHDSETKDQPTTTSSGQKQRWSFPSFRTLSKVFSNPS